MKTKKATAKPENDLVQIHLSLDPAKVSGALILKNLADWKSKYKTLNLTNAKIVRIILEGAKVTK